LRLPPVVDHRHAELLLRPVQRVGIAPLAGEEEGAESAQIVAPHVLPSGIVALDGADRRGRREEYAHPVLRDHPPERARIRGADGLPSYSTVVLPLKSGPYTMYEWPTAQPR